VTRPCHTGHALPVVLSVRSWPATRKLERIVMANAVMPLSVSLLVNSVGDDQHGEEGGPSVFDR
jgi:hypothetical protein